MISRGRWAGWLAPTGHRFSVFALVRVQSLLLSPSSWSQLSSSRASELNVMISGGFRTAYQELVPKFERKTVWRTTRRRSLYEIAHCYGLVVI